MDGVGNTKVDGSISESGSLVVFSSFFEGSLGQDIAMVMVIIAIRRCVETPHHVIRMSALFVLVSRFLTIMDHQAASTDPLKWMVHGEFRLGLRFCIHSL